MNNSESSASVTWCSGTCHGCGGRGWVDSQYKGAVLCPVCGGSGKCGSAYTITYGGGNICTATKHTEEYLSYVDAIIKLAKEAKILGNKENPE